MLPTLNLVLATRALDVARALQEGGVAPHLALALRLDAVAGGSSSDSLGDQSFEALVRSVAKERPHVATGARAAYWFARSERDEDESRAAEAAAVRAIHEGHAGGLGLALRPRQVLALDARREAPPTEPTDRAVLARNLPSQPALGETWSGLVRAERLLSRLADRRSGDDLFEPWSRGRAHLLDLQGPFQDWAMQWWAEGADHRDVVLAIDRGVAFHEHRLTDEAAAYWAIFWHLRWTVLSSDAGTRRGIAVMGRTAALRHSEILPSAALRGLAADLALDVACFDQAGPDAVSRARAEAEAATRQGLLVAGVPRRRLVATRPRPRGRR